MQGRRSLGKEDGRDREDGMESEECGLHCQTVSRLYESDRTVLILLYPAPIGSARCISPCTEKRSQNYRSNITGNQNGKQEKTECVLVEFFRLFLIAIWKKELNLFLNFSVYYFDFFFEKIGRILHFICVQERCTYLKNIHIFLLPFFKYWVT